VRFFHKSHWTDRLNLDVYDSWMNGRAVAENLRCKWLIVL
jgi:hypothetical protein